MEVKSGRAGRREGARGRDREGKWEEWWNSAAVANLERVQEKVLLLAGPAKERERGRQASGEKKEEKKKKKKEEEVCRPVRRGGRAARLRMIQ